MTRPNVIWICTDQQRSDSLGCAGHPVVRTPNIDSIAAGGTRFARHNTPMQICSPSRATMVTGCYPRHHGLVMNGMALPEHVATLPGQLAAAGYRTHSVGKQHLQPLLAPADLKMPDSRAFWQSGEARTWRGPYYGYQTLDLLLGESDTATIAGHYADWLRTNHPGSLDLLDPRQSPTPPPPDLDEIWDSAMPLAHHYNTWITDRSVDFMEQVAPSDQPFFLFVSYPDPHHPFDPPAPYTTRYDPNDMPLPTLTNDELDRLPAWFGDLYPQGKGFRELYWSADPNMECGSMITTRDISDASLRQAIAYTCAMIEYIDDGVGRILSSLHDTGQLDNTVVLFTSDHGELLGDHGLLHKGPPPYRQLTEISLLMRGPGIRSGQVVEGLTSHLDLAPTTLELAGVEGELSGEDGASLLPLLNGSASSIREHDFGEYHPTSRPELYNQTVRTPEWRLTLYPDLDGYGELFNLADDPSECVNRFDDPSCAVVRRELAARLAEDFPPQRQVDTPWLCKW